MKKLFLIKAIILSCVLMSFTKKENTFNKVDLVGTWSYTVPEAAYEYQEGTMIFKNADGKLTGYILI